MISHKVDLRLKHRLLSRVDIQLSINELLRTISREYVLGDIICFNPIEIGYEELNIALTTTRGKYLVKIFSKGKDRVTVLNYIHGLLEFSKAGIPVPHLQMHKNGYLFETAGENSNTYLCVMDYFNGKSFNDIKPTETDIRTVTKYIAKIHSLNFQVGHNYDSWGTAHLIEEFEKKERYLNPKDMDLILPVVQNFKLINFNNLRRCVIHGDLQRNNILKNSDGECCILDFGSMAFDAAVVDLGIFLAMFCIIDDIPRHKDALVNLVIQEYQELLPLNSDELASIPLLIQATFASYLLSSSYSILAMEDNNPQTKKWMTLSRKGLKFF